MIRVTIDDCEIETEPGHTVLEVARERGIHIPTLCFHQALEPFAACRLCVVEVDAGRGWTLAASCAYPCSDGLIVRTQSEAVLKSRRLVVEFLMASSAHVPLIRQLAGELGAGQPRFVMEADDCIMCGLCVRACKEIVGVGAISVINRGIDKRISTPFQIASDTCIECGTCILICPTGAIRFADITSGAHTVHTHKSAFEALNCRICASQDLSLQTADFETLRQANIDLSRETAGESVR